jgi:hypothetical protein
MTPCGLTAAAGARAGAMTLSPHFRISRRAAGTHDSEVRPTAQFSQRTSARARGFCLPLLGRGWQGGEHYRAAEFSRARFLGCGTGERTDSTTATKQGARPDSAPMPRNYRRGVVVPAGQRTGLWRGGGLPLTACRSDDARAPLGAKSRAARGRAKRRTRSRGRGSDAAGLRSAETRGSGTDWCGSGRPRCGSPRTRARSRRTRRCRCRPPAPPSPSDA